MEYFFYEDEFCADLEDLLHVLEVHDEEDLKRFSDNWSIKVILSELKPMFQIKESDVKDMAEMLSTNYEERFSEDGDRQYERIEASLIKHISAGVIDKINADIPKLYYPIDEEGIITKQDLIEHFSI